MMKHGAQANLCQICHLRPGHPIGWCKQCRDSYDRAQTKDDGTVLAVIMWAAKRARWFALAQGKKTRR